MRLTFNSSLGSALLTYDNIESSAIAIENMRGRCIGRTGRVKVRTYSFIYSVIYAVTYAAITTIIRNNSSILIGCEWA